MTRSARTCFIRSALAASLLLLSVRAASPHAEVLRSTPAPGAVITTAPVRVHIWFSESIEAPSTSAVTVYAPDGTRVDQSAAAISPDDATELSTPVSLGAPGTYTVRWQAVSADGHPINGTFQFSLGTTSATAVPIDTAPQTPRVGFQASGRWLHLVALSLVVGPLVLMVLLGWERAPEIHARLWRLAVLGALALLPAAAIMLGAQSAAVSGTVSDGLRADTLRSLLGTGWGTLWTVRTALGAVLAGIIVLGARGADRTRAMTAIASLALVGVLVVATSLNGHPAATNPVWLSVAIDWAHTAATLTWAGGLIALAVAVLPGLKKMQSGARTSLLASVVPRFSTTALICVQVLVLTGLYHTWAHVAGPSALTSTSYGVTLLVKLALVGATILTAAVNLFVFKPRFAAAAQTMGDERTSGSTLGLFHRLVAAEVLLVVAILGAVGVLTSLPPASAAASTASAAPAATTAAEPETPPAIVLVDHAGPAVVTLSLGSAEIGSNRTTVALQGGPAEASTQVRLRIEPPATSGISPSTITPDKAGQTWRATLPLAPAGSWGINVVVSSGTTTDVAAFRVDLPLRGPGELLAAADERMNGLRSVVEDVEVFANGARAEERNDYQAPDRRRHQGELLEITAGDRLYMRHGTLWHTQTVTPFRWPAYQFAGRATDVTVLGREMLDGVECFVVSFVDKRDGSRQRLWIATGNLRVLRQISAAPGRLSISRFSRFDAGPAVAPPS